LGDLHFHEVLQNLARGSEAEACGAMSEMIYHMLFVPLHTVQRMHNKEGKLNMNTKKVGHKDVLRME
jgi:hypothetical protein